MTSTSFVIVRLLDHARISRLEALNLMVTQLGSDSSKAQREIEDTRGWQARFAFLSENSINHLNAVVDATGDDA